jgi:hypothetical protein
MAIHVTIHSWFFFYWDYWTFFLRNSRYSLLRFHASIWCKFYLRAIRYCMAQIIWKLFNDNLTLDSLFKPLFLMWLWFSFFSLFCITYTVPVLHFIILSAVYDNYISLEFDWPSKFRWNQINIHFMHEKPILNS